VLVLLFQYDKAPLTPPDGGVKDVNMLMSILEILNLLTLITIVMTQRK